MTFNCAGSERLRNVLMYDEQLFAGFSSYSPETKELDYKYSNAVTRDRRLPKVKVPTEFNGTMRRTLVHTDDESCLLFFRRYAPLLWEGKDCANLFHVLSACHPDQKRIDLLVKLTQQVIKDLSPSASTGPSAGPPTSPGHLASWSSENWMTLLRYISPSERPSLLRTIMTRWPLANIEHRHIRMARNSERLLLFYDYMTFQDKQMRLRLAQL